MADRKITDLAALTAPAAGDLLPIVDISEASASDKNKKITYSDFLTNIPAGTITSTMILDGTILNADINASAAIVDTKLATISTGGKVSNSATTATDANTPSAIVARDASGDFTAGTITAGVVGAASLNVLKAGDTMTGDLTLNAQSELRLADADSSHYIALLAPAVVGANVSLTLPADDGTNGQVLSTDGSGILSWATGSGGTVTSIDVSGGTGLTATGGPITSSGTITIDLDNTAVTPASYTNASITVDAQGRLTAASSGTAAVTTVTGTSPIASTGGATPDISIQDGTTTQKGAVQLEDSTTSTSTTKAATPNSVKLVLDAATVALGIANDALPKAGGTLTGNVILDNQVDARFREATANGTNYVGFQAPASIAADVLWTLPAVDGTAGQALVTDGATVLGWSAVGTGDVTLTGTQTLTNKTLATPTVTGDLTINAQGDLRLADSDSSNYIALQAPATVASNVTFTLPATDGTVGQVLSTNGTGTLSFATAGGGDFGSGTIMLFVQTTAPTGWTKSTTHNNKALRLVNGTVGTGGTQNFTDVLNGNVGATTLTEAQIPSHNHSLLRGNTTPNMFSTGYMGAQSPNPGLTTGSTGGGGSHTHSMNIAYVDVIIATKN